MQHHTFSLPVQGIPLFAQAWQPDNTPKAVICLIHGHGEHSGRYAEVAAFFEANQFATYAVDCIGHGKSPGTRGATPSYDFLLEMVAVLQQAATAQHPDCPVFIYGHSMGGNIVINYVCKHKPAIRGAILSSPWFKLAFDPPKIQVKLAQVVQNILPNLVQHSKLDANAISQIPAEVKRYQEDPLIHDCITPRLFFGCYEAGIWALNEGKTDVPLLLQHGTGDRLISYEASKAFAARLGAQTTFVSWEGGYHELHHDPARTAFLQTSVDWILNRL